MQFPDRLALICTNQRSGSTMLSSALADTGVAGNPQEYFLSVDEPGRVPLCVLVDEMAPPSWVWLTRGMQEYTAVTGVEVANDPTLADWRFIHGVIRSDFGAASYPAATELAMAIATAAEAAEHHPDIDIRYPGRVRVALTTHATGGLTDRDVSLARTISDLAAGAGASPDPSKVQAVEIAIDTTDVDRIRPFWQAVLGYNLANDNLVDPARSDPTVWFQNTDQPRTDRGRFHVDIDMPHDLVEERMAAAIAAGGILVSDEFAPSWWVLADADGNEACLCTWQPHE